MSTPPSSSPSSAALASLPSAFAAACRVSRTDAELFERCREALVRRFHSDGIWFAIHSPEGSIPRVGPARGDGEADEVTRIHCGETEVVITAEPPVAALIRPVTMPVAVGLALVIELRGVMLERQESLDDAVFQLRALRQVARLLSSVHSSGETEQLILDFLAEVFFAWWACLYRPAGENYEPKVFRSLNDRIRARPIPRAVIDGAMPPGGPPSTAEDVALAAVVLPGTELLVPLDAGVERLALLLLGPRISGKPYGRAEHELAGTLSFAGAIALKNAELVEQLHNAATTDQLTGLSNRRALEDRLQGELGRAHRHHLHTSLILTDLDRFKAINDSLGHPAGDRLLKAFADLLKQQCRALDVVGRLGGDEFLVILPMTNADEAMVFVERVQAAVAALAPRMPEFGSLSVSLGVAEAPRHGGTVGKLLAAADAALYKAKRAGGNTAQVAG